MAEKKDLKKLVEEERKKRCDAAMEILKKAIEEIEAMNCSVDISVLVTTRGNVPQLQVISKE